LEGEVRRSGWVLAVCLLREAAVPDRVGDIAVAVVAVDEEVVMVAAPPGDALLLQPRRMEEQHWHHLVVVENLERERTVGIEFVLRTLAT
jgi:hypothetical protein